MSHTTPQEAQLVRALTDLADVLQTLVLRSEHLRRTMESSREDLADLHAAVEAAFTADPAAVGDPDVVLVLDHIETLVLLDESAQLEHLTECLKPAGGGR